MNIVLPKHLQEDTPSFVQWLQVHVREQQLVGVAIGPDVVRLSCPLAYKAYKYEKMWAYGNHFQVDIETKLQHLTYDSGVACIFNQASRSSTQDHNLLQVVVC
jgi:hypothetical protein